MKLINAVSCNWRLLFFLNYGATEGTVSDEVDICNWLQLKTFFKKKFAAIEGTVSDEVDICS